MTILNFIENNPDLVTLIVGAITGLVYKRGKGVKLDDLWETLLQVGRQAFPVLMRDAKLYDDTHVREVITKTIWAGLTRLGVDKGNPTVSKLIDEAVEHIHGELAAMVLKYHLSQLEKPLQGAADALKKLPEDKAIEATP